MKKTKILRPKQKIGTFYNNCKNIVYQESILNDKEWRLFCDPLDLITLDNQREGWKWLQGKQKSSDIIVIKGKLYVLSNSAPKDTILVEISKKYIRCQRSEVYEEGFDEWAELRATVHELIKVDEKFFTCNCRDGIKKQWCKHRIGLMIKTSLLSIQDNAKCVPLSKPRKRGRIAVNKGWWSHV